MDVVLVRKKEMKSANDMRTAKASVPSGVSLELIAASREVGIQVMAEICQSFRWIWNAS